MIKSKERVLADAMLKYNELLNKRMDSVTNMLHQYRRYNDAVIADRKAGNKAQEHKDAGERSKMLYFAAVGISGIAHTIQAAYKYDIGLYFSSGALDIMSDEQLLIVCKRYIALHKKAEMVVRTVRARKVA